MANGAQEPCSGYPHVQRPPTISIPACRPPHFLRCGIRDAASGLCHLSFRYNVIGSQPTNEQERIYNAVAGQISRKEITEVQAALSAMSSIYLGDDAFRAVFSEKVMRTTQSRNRRVVRYILCSLEKRLTGQDLDFDSTSLSLEHVLPENPEAGWDAPIRNEKARSWESS
jgi:hypothetical protein